MDKSAQDREYESLREQSRSVIEEARMVMPGLQALFGFQLIAVFNQRFAELDADLQIMHLCAIAFITVSIALIMAPAAYDRIVERDSVSAYFIQLSTKLIASAMLALACGLSVEFYIICRMIVDHSVVSAIFALCALVLCVGMWFVFPFARRARRLHSGKLSMRRN
jgi:hypothetical protein